MKNKPRIAFCISGQARTFDTTYPFFKLNLFDVAKEQGFEYDIFCAVEDDEDLEKVHIMNPTIIEKIKSSEVQKIIDEKYGDFINRNFNKRYCFHMYKDSHIKGFLQQVYKVKIANSIKNNFMKEKKINYDIVFRLRFDVFFLNKFNFNEIYNSIKNSKNILNKGTRDIVPIQDFFAIGDNSFIDSFSSVFDNFIDIFKGNELNVFEKILLRILNFGYLFQYFLEKNIGGLISRLNGFLIYIVATFINKYIFTIFTSEKIYYENLKKYDYVIDFSHISLLLIRKDFEKSGVLLNKKSQYET